MITTLSVSFARYQIYALLLGCINGQVQTHEDSGSTWLSPLRVTGGRLHCCFKHPTCDHTLFCIWHNISIVTTLLHVTETAHAPIHHTLHTASSSQTHVMPEIPPTLSASHIRGYSFGHRDPELLAPKVSSSNKSAQKY